MNPTNEVIIDIQATIKAFAHYAEGGTGEYEGLSERQWRRIAIDHLLSSNRFQGFNNQDFVRFDNQQLLGALQLVTTSELASTTLDEEKREQSQEEAERRQKEEKMARAKAKIPPPPIIPPRPGASQPPAQPVEAVEPEPISLATIIQSPKFEVFSPQTKEKIVNLHEAAKLGKEKFTDEVIPKTVPGLSPAQLKLAIDSLFAKAQEMPIVLAKEALGLGSSPEERKLIEGIGGKELVDILSPTPQKPTEIPKVEVVITPTVEIPFPSIILGAYAKSIENKDPGRANALKLSLYGVSKENLELLRFAAKSKGYNISSKNLAIAAKTFEENSDLMRLGLMPVITDPKQFRLPPEVYQLFASEQMSLSQNTVVYRQPGIFGSAKDIVTNLASNFFGKRIEGFVETKLGTGLVIKSAERVVTEATARVTAEAGTKIGISASVKASVSQAIVKGGTQLATKLFGSAAGETIGAILGNTIAPVIGAIAGFIVGLIAEKILPWIKKHLNEIGLFLGGFGILTASPIFIAGGVLTLGAGIMAAGTGLTVGMAGVFATLGAGFAWIGRTLLSEITKPLIITLITLPIVIGFILLVINNSAYMVPPGEPLSGNYPPINPGPVVSGSCPLSGSYEISVPSYDPANEIGHGSNNYWLSCGSYPIPIESMYPGCNGPTPNIPNYNPNNVCANETDLCPYFGYATDVEPIDKSTHPEVGLPYLCDPGTNPCPELTWTLGASWYNCRGQDVPSKSDCSGVGWGYGYILTANGNGHSWQIYLNHIDPSQVWSVGQTFQSGDMIGTITREISSAVTGASHVHIELNIDGVPVRPDFMCQ